MIDGEFYLNNHGSLTPVSESKYHESQLAEQRGFTAIPAAFYLFIALCVYWSPILLRSEGRGPDLKAL
jgi:hypothetical protein